MSKNNRSNVLLVEILIAVLFFMLSATVLVRVFAASHALTVRAGVETQALSEAQNAADTLYAAGDVEAALEAQGFRSAHGAWTKNCGDFTLYVEGGSQAAGAGSLWEGQVLAYYNRPNASLADADEDALFALPFARYRAVQP